MNAIYHQLPVQLKRYVDLAKECGSSSWRSVLLLNDQDFLLHKRVFRDALCLHYGWTLPNTPRLCNCGNAFSPNHAMVCHMGASPPFSIIRSENNSITLDWGVLKCSNRTPPTTTLRWGYADLFLPSLMMMHIWIYVREASGTIGYIFLMSWCFPPTLLVTVKRTFNCV